MNGVLTNDVLANDVSVVEGLAKDAVLEESAVDSTTLEDEELDWQVLSLLWIEEKKSSLSGDIVSLAQYIDGLIGDTDAIKDANRSYLRVYLGGEYSHFYDFEEQISARFSLDLPLAKKKLRLVIENADNFLSEDELSTEQLGDDSLQDDSVYASLRYLFSSNNWQRLSFDYGAKVRLRPDLFARARAVRTWPVLEGWSFRFSQDLFWYESIGLGSKSGFDFDHNFSQQLLFRFANYAHWHERDSHYDLGQSVSYFHDYSAKRAMQYTFGYDSVHDDSHCVVSNYYLKTNYRRNIYNDWLFYQVSTGVSFPREFDYEINPFISIRLEVLFSESVDKKLSTRMY